MRKIKVKYPVTPEVKQKIIGYCNDLVLLFQPQFLHNNNILENEFLEYLYASCEAIYEQNKEYKLLTNEIIALVEHKKRNDLNVYEIEQGIAIVTNIDKNDNLIFDYKENLKKKLIEDKK